MSDLERIAQLEAESAQRLVACRVKDQRIFELTEQVRQVERQLADARRSLAQFRDRVVAALPTPEEIQIARGECE